MSEMLLKAWRLVRDERGIETAEWTVILGFIVLVAVVIYGAGGSLPGLLTTVMTGISGTLSPLT